MIAPDSPCTVRRATPADVDLLTAVGAATFAETWAPHNTPADLAAYLREAFGPAQQLAELTDPDGTMLLAEVFGESVPVGYAHLLRHAPPACVTGPAPLEMVRLYVRRAWHSHRVGAALMTASLGEARRAGARTLWLGVWPENHLARRFYQAWGFEQVGRKIFVLGEDVSEDLVLTRAVGEE
ncbi:MAG: GNAT family N-acetyltransferase [Hymenobacteraceae bacterium]|nr:GNAT family N-acetyltransferase [Hymenobacteraceae bacterium]